MHHAHLLRAFALFVTSAVCLGCVTTEQVRSIVAEANASAIAADAAALFADPAAADNWQTTIARIEAFIAEHPNEAVTSNALRMREAIVLLNAGQTNLARAVFEEVDRSLLGGTRDIALYDAREHLLWWHELGEQLSESDEARGREALAGIANVADTLPRTDQTRRMLETERIRIAIRLALGRRSEDGVRSLLDDAMARYAAQWDERDRRAIQAWHVGGAVTERADLPTLRWYDYVPTAFVDADEILLGACEAECPTYTPPWIACIADRAC